MTKEQNLSLKNPSVLFLSFFGTGFAPIAPGTVGSLASIPFIVLLYYLLKPLPYATAILISFIALATIYTCTLTDKVQKKLNLHDPGWIVIDEVLGMFVTWAFALSINPIYLLLCFMSFRFFDIIKIWPASFFDRKVHHGAGTILDDIISGIYAGLLVQIFLHFCPNVLML